MAFAYDYGGYGMATSSFGVDTPEPEEPKYSSSSKGSHREMTMTKACNLLGMRDHDFRECDLESLRLAFSKKVTMSCNISDKDPAAASKFSKMYRNHMLIHEAYQYLLKKRTAQLAALEKKREELRAAQHRDQLEARKLENKFRTEPIPTVEKDDEEDLTESKTVEPAEDGSKSEPDTKNSTCAKESNPEPSETQPEEANKEEDASAPQEETTAQPETNGEGTGRKKSKRRGRKKSSSTAPEKEKGVNEEKMIAEILQENEQKEKSDASPPPAEEPDAGEDDTDAANADASGSSAAPGVPEAPTSVRIVNNKKVVKKKKAADAASPAPSQRRGKKSSTESKEAKKKQQRKKTGAGSGTAGVKKTPTLAKKSKANGK